MSPTVAIIGAGYGGLTVAVGLIKKLGLENLIILEKRSDVGGTWRDNIYPGCSSDVPMIMYSLSTDPYDWAGSHGTQEEILNYVRYLADKYDLHKYIRLNSEVISATWDTVLQRYEIVTRNPLTKEQRTSYAEIIFTAHGVLETPRFPDIPGLGSFRGNIWHSATWDKSVDLRGKRVAVIGNATSAAQFVPRISEDPSVEVVNFCRTGNWYLPPIRYQFSQTRRWLTRNVPGLNYILRFFAHLKIDIAYLSIFSPTFRFLRPLAYKISKDYVKANAPKKYHQYLFPPYDMGCKRVIADTGYVPALQRPNLDLNWDGIASIVEDGIVTKKGERIPFDVLIFATGFYADVFGVPIYGKHGKSVREYYEEQGGGWAYRGTTVPGFPNMFIMTGPNMITGHSSVIFSTEIQVEYAVQLLKPMFEGHLKSVEPTEEATDKYNEHIQERMSKTVFTTCLSWYRHGGEGRISSIFPGAATRIWWYLRKPIWKDFTTVPANFKPGTSWTSIIARSTILLALVLGGLEYHKQNPTAFQSALTWVLNQEVVQSARRVLSV